jgi:hypothetical protein
VQRRRRILVTVLCVSLAAGVAAAALRAASAPRFISARVCPYEQFSRRLYQCTRDSRATPLTTNKFTCSTVVDTDQPVDVRFRVSYDGGPVTGWRPLHIRSGATPLWFAYSVGTNLPLPAGSWTCTFIAGAAKLTIPFHTHGQTGDVVDLAICAGQDTIGPVRNGVCRKDESTAGLPATSTVLCSVYVTHHVGSIPTIEILDGAGATLFTYSGNPIASTLWAVWTWYTPGAGFTPGQYACRVSVDGQVAVTRSFAING